MRAIKRDFVLILLLWVWGGGGGHDTPYESPRTSNPINHRFRVIFVDFFIFIQFTQIQTLNASNLKKHVQKVFKKSKKKKNTNWWNNNVRCNSRSSLRRWDLGTWHFFNFKSFSIFSIFFSPIFHWQIFDSIEITKAKSILVFTARADNNGWLLTSTVCLVYKFFRYLLFKELHFLDLISLFLFVLLQMTRVMPTFEADEESARPIVQNNNK